MNKSMVRLIGSTMVITLAITLFVLTIGARLQQWTFTLPTASGMWTWNFSRAAGVTSYLALTLDVVFGLMLSTAIMDRWISRAMSLELHRFLSTVTLWLVVAHAVILLGDGYMRFDLLDITIPMVSSYRPLPIAAGIIAGFTGYVVHKSFDWRKRLGAKVWRAIHYATFVLFGVATFHGIAAGSDTHRPVLQAMYSVSSVVVAGLTMWRILQAITKLRHKRLQVSTTHN